MKTKHICNYTRESKGVLIMDARKGVPTYFSCWRESIRTWSQYLTSFIFFLWTASLLWFRIGQEMGLTLRVNVLKYGDQFLKVERLVTIKLKRENAWNGLIFLILTVNVGRECSWIMLIPKRFSKTWVMFGQIIWYNSQDHWTMLIF